jgi:hypothetical protein
MPVHENNDVIRITIDNVRSYIQNFTIVLHVSETFADFDWSIRDLPNVLINPIRQQTLVWGNFLGIHLSNHRHAVASGIKYSRFCILHTTEMFVKHGLESSISNHSHALWYNRSTMPRNTEWPQLQIATESGMFYGIFPNDSWYIGCQIEGTWYSIELMEKIYNLVSNKKPWMLSSKITWPLEEVAFPSLANFFSNDGEYGNPYCAYFLPDRPTSIDDVDNVIFDQPVKLWMPNGWLKPNPPILTSSVDKYSVKRIDRNSNDAVRQYIVNLPKTPPR